ncbi:MAG: glycosly transferase [Alphaproteobacteria bacterium]|nr:glycosly transferase [Alphaproteobacteria bacterium]
MSLVSVVMPVLDGALHLAEAVDSILAQTHDELELVIVDDGSSDATPEIIASYAGADPRVRPLYLERNPALTSGARAANAGIAIARGEWIARMDHDDVAYPRRLAAQLALLREQELDACGGKAVAFGEDKERVFWFPERHDALERELVFRVGILHPTMVATAELMRRLPYDERASHDDYEWQTRAAACGRLGNCAEIVLRHRVHPGQSNVVHRTLFGRDLRQYRFRHFYRLFPKTPAAEYQIVNALAERGRLVSRAELEVAGAWLARLADLPDPALRGQMAKRWENACDKADLPDIDDLRSHFAALIRAGEEED